MKLKFLKTLRKIDLKIWLVDTTSYTLLLSFNDVYQQKLYLPKKPFVGEKHSTARTIPWPQNLVEKVLYVIRENYFSSTVEPPNPGTGISEPRIPPSDANRNRNKCESKKCCKIVFVFGKCQKRFPRNLTYYPLYEKF